VEDNKRYCFKTGFYGVFKGQFIVTQQYDGDLFIYDKIGKQFVDIDGEAMTHIYEQPPKPAIVVDTLVSIGLSEALERLNMEHDLYENQLKETLNSL
jgi:hypothetical protein